MRRIAALLSAALLLVLGGCALQPGGASKPQRYEKTFLQLFDTVTTVVAYRDSAETFHAEAQFIQDELGIYHRLYDIYNDYEGVSNVKTINDNAGVAPVKVDQKIIDMLLEARRMYDETGGKMNVAMGSVLAIWHEYRQAGLDEPEQAELPPMEALCRAAEHTDINDMVIDEAAATVYLTDPDMRLDVGAIAKGYAAQAVCDAARARGTGSMLISVGGNVCAIGTRLGPDDPWPVGVEDPTAEDSQNYLQALSIADQSLVTSGSYQRYYTVDGKNYHHIIDPDTLMPADYFASVTILSDDSGTADALATALFNLPYEAGRALVDGLAGTEAMWVEKDGQQRFTEGFSAVLNPK